MDEKTRLVHGEYTRVSAEILRHQGSTRSGEVQPSRNICERRWLLRRWTTACELCLPPANFWRPIHGHNDRRPKTWNLARLNQKCLTRSHPTHVVDGEVPQLHDPSES